PERTDYMDRDTAAFLASRGFAVGLHGHQHRTESETHKVVDLNNQFIIAVSAGSLCAGRNELPTGQYRAYNIIEISDDYSTLKLNAYAMHQDGIMRPIILNQVERQSELTYSLATDSAPVLKQ